MGSSGVKRVKRGLSGLRLVKEIAVKVKAQNADRNLQGFPKGGLERIRGDQTVVVLVAACT